MNIVFMGTPDFAVPSLKRLIEKQDVCPVFFFLFQNYLKLFVV